MTYIISLVFQYMMTALTTLTSANRNAYTLLTGNMNVHVLKGLNWQMTSGLV